MKRVFIVHGWGGNPEEAFFPWLKKELEEKGFRVIAPSMPDTENPKIDSWVSFLKESVGDVDKDTYFVGHSIGCQTVLRFLESLEKGEVGGVVLVAGWVHLTPETYEDEGDEEIAKPWIETPLEWEKIKSHCKRFVAIHSDNDPYVPLKDGDIFKERLGAGVIVEHDKKHFSGEGEVKELPSALESVLKVSE
jgi:predicted alpha/beta hydrolase family esterase